MAFDAYYAARDTIFDFIHQDAFGPVGTDEVLEEPPLETYVCGVLWPRKTKSRTSQPAMQTGDEPIREEAPDRECGFALEEDQTDVIREANHFMPSVMAVSFALPVKTKELSLSFFAAKYVHQAFEEISPKEKRYIRHEYRRVPLETGWVSVALPLRAGKRSFFDGMITVRIVRRRTISDIAVLWTVSVENNQKATQNETDQNTAALFQCVLSLRGCFCPIDSAGKPSVDAERRRQDFIYRNTRVFAAGHGCSVHWEEQEDGVSEIRSAFLPRTAVSQMIAATDKTFSCFLMSKWTDEWRREGLAELERYVGQYAAWGEKLRCEPIPDGYRQAADDILERIFQCVERLRNGIDVLRKNDAAWRAFCLMNQAMARQSAKKRKQPESEVSWYPFQLCYALMCLPDVTEENAPWRGTVDLLWFPTGGGKTEAYLGVAAFTIFYRRLTQGEKSGGVTVLMRYTLRMLTAQQFERAAALICECEYIRREEHLPGGEISIGLWVGSEVTPNHVESDQEGMESAKTILDQLITGREAEVRSSPVQLPVCPFCGALLRPKDAYRIENHQFRAFCPSKACPFHDDLPIVTVDDDIYARKPTLLIGTIDKFARLAWEEKTKALFAADGDGLPPELLIQDELHLISGPLGSISGLYEIAIEKLIASRGKPPKILASTATLRNAQGQIMALYGKPAFQFPPSGFYPGDSFFARIARPDERPQRMYVGYCETGGSMPDAVVRVFGAVKFALQYLACRGENPAVIDQFWTNIGYFNSLKDLGSADTLILDRVCAYAEALRRHKFRELAEAVNMPPISGTEYDHDELTSRKTAREITEVRNHLDTVHYPDAGAYEYVLSSNMLSVGIDINRLGLMTVYNQPKSTSEYIQATSRVGRSNPGLVIVLLNMLRTRDMSHYEHFQASHHALNKMVEPTSAAPYACQAMDKALHTVFVILVRHLCPDMTGNRDAANFRKDREDIQALRQELLSVIRRRSPETGLYAQEILDDFIEQWDQEARNKGSHFQYQLFNQSENDTDALLIPAERSDAAIFPPTLNSMRNVDTQSGVYLKRRKAP